MRSGYISFHSSSIHYLRWGSANKLLICFHGYAESAAHFQFLAHEIEDEFTIVAIDLPFHGETSWTNENITGRDLHFIVMDIIKKENLGLNNTHLIGFSLGGRIALSLYQEMPQAIQRIVLLAPDGLKQNFWYWLSTQTFLGNKCFKWTMQSPGWFLGMLRIGNKIKMINRSIYKFVEYYIHDEKVRKELYARWTSMRKCNPDLQQIRRDIEKSNTIVRLLYGAHDRIILSSPALRFIKGLQHAKIEILDCGHQVLNSKNVHEIVKALID